MELIYAGLNALIDYVALHVVTCLIPAFLLAGAITTFLSREVIVRFMGSTSRRIVSFPLAAVSGIGLAVCSCTVIPIAAGLYRRGSSLGPAFIILWTAPATNLLALVYTGAILGLDMAAMRVIAALSTAFIVGLIMVSVFRGEEKTRAAKMTSKASKSVGGVSPLFKGRSALTVMLMLIATLLLPNYLGVGRPFIQKVEIFLVPFIITFLFAFKFFSWSEIREWLSETLWFVKLIFPPLLLGVFIIGIVGKIIPEWWVREWLSGNFILSTFIACLIGALSYFATLTEAPFVSMLMKLGMGKGPALALLLAGPGLSLPNMLAITRIFTVRKASVYILTTVALATLSAFAIGNLLWA